MRNVINLNHNLNNYLQLHLKICNMNIGSNHVSFEKNTNSQWPSLLIICIYLCKLKLKVYRRKVQSGKIFLLVAIFYLQFQVIFSQQTSRDNYTGEWNLPASWNPTWAAPQTYINGFDITIYGHITLNGSLYVLGNSDQLIINDTLVVIGNLSVGNKSKLTINNNGILIVKGNLLTENNSVIKAHGYLVVTGNFTKQGSTKDGELTSNDNPVKVFIGGIISPIDLTNHKSGFPALDCVSPSTIAYANSGCSYGNMMDFTADPLYPFFQTICTIATPTISASGSTTFCAGGVVRLTSDNGTSYLWSTGETTQNIKVTTSGSYTVKVKNSTGCQSSVSKTMVVKVNTNPTTPTITPTGSTTFCYGGSVSLTSSPAKAYLWSTGATTHSVLISAQGKYSVKVTDSIGCQSGYSDTSKVIINALPVIKAGNDVTIPNGTNTTIQATVSGTGPFIYSWSPSSKLVNAALEDPTTVNLSTTTLFTLTATSSTTMCSANDQVTVIISGGLLGAFPATDHSSVCAGENVHLKSLASGGSGNYTYNWTSMPSGFISSAANPTVNPYVTTIYLLAVSDGFTTMNAQVEVKVNALPKTPIINPGGSINICEGGSITLIPGAGESYFWSTGETTPYIVVTSAGSYSVQIKDDNGCQSAISAATKVTIYVLPKINITSDSSLCLNDQMTLTATPEGGLFSIVDGPGSIFGNVLSALGVGAIHIKYTFTNVCTNLAMQSLIVNDPLIPYAGSNQELDHVFETNLEALLFGSETGDWSLISGSGQFSDAHSPTSGVKGLGIGENKFLWTIHQGNCKANDEMTISVKDLFIPSVITPNGDGKNDFFIVNENSGQVELSIINPWGYEEYTVKNYQNTWDGRNNNGVPLPNGTYFYILKFQNGNIHKGSVLIKK